MQSTPEIHEFTLGKNLLLVKPGKNTFKTDLTRIFQQRDLKQDTKIQKEPTLIHR